jgi:uncharacterized protein (UPF0210 family)
MVPLPHVTRRLVPLALLLALPLTAAAQAPSKEAPPPRETRPKVRAITGFVRIDRDHATAQLHDALGMLRSARASFKKDGWEVETIRITTQPFTDYLAGLTREQAVAFFVGLGALAEKEGFLLAIGPAMSLDEDDPQAMDLLGEVLCKTKRINATTLIASKFGIHWKAIRATARMIKYVQDRSPDSQGNFSFTAAAMMPEYAPFYPASYHTGLGHTWSVGLESANLVDQAFAGTAGDPAAASTRLKEALAKYTSLAEKTAQSVSQASGWEYLGLDPTPAPLKDVSIGAAIERFTGRPFGSSGTLSAARLITDAVKTVTAKKVGYSGLMLPVLEDSRIAQRWSEGALHVDSLLAYSAVCATGLDTVPLPGGVTEEQLARILGDVASLAYTWKKPLTARLLPVKGGGPGQRTQFKDPSLDNAILQPLP